MVQVRPPPTPGSAFSPSGGVNTPAQSATQAQQQIPSASAYIAAQALVNHRENPTASHDLLVRTLQPVVQQGGLGAIPGNQAAANQLVQEAISLSGASLTQDQRAAIQTELNRALHDAGVVREAEQQTR